MKYRKKPVVIDAVRYDGSTESANQLLGWMGTNAQDATKIRGNLIIATLEGAMTANPGDWIIRGVQGEFYPCKPDIFDATYQPVEDTE